MGFSKTSGQLDTYFLFIDLNDRKGDMFGALLLDSKPHARLVLAH